MLNQPVNSAFSAESAEIIVPGSAGRFRLVLVLFCLAVVVILVRTGWVQSQLMTAYLDALNVTTTEYELIPARDGRILASGAVLAADEDLYSVEVHYRWLEDPVSEQWVSHQLRSELTREERRDTELAARVHESCLQQRTLLWQQLHEISGIPRQTLKARRERIQLRVERIAADVNRRRRKKLQGQSGITDTSDLESLSEDESAGVLLKIARAIRQSVTTPPERMTEDRIVVREEEGYHVVIRDVPLTVAAEIRSHPERFPGTRVVVATRRTYPQGGLCSHAVGARTALRDDERKRLDTITQQAITGWIPRRGRSGVEYSWDHRLRGTAGLRKTVRNRRQQIVETSVVRNPAAGGDVVVTIHPELQRHAERLLAEALTDAPRLLLPVPDNDNATSLAVPHGGSVVIMDVNTGRLLAAASAPGIDLELFTSGTEKEWAAVNADRRQPFFSRTISMALPPGSVFKPLTAVAAIESGVLNPDAPFYCQGFLDNPDEHRCLVFRLHGTGHEDITLDRALAQSCNVYFFRAGTQTGMGRLYDWSVRFGFGAPTGIDLPFEKSGALPPRPPQEAFDTVRPRFERESVGFAIGQSQLTATPLQVVRMMAAIANGGWLVVPHIVSPDGVARTADEIDDTPRELSRRRIRGLHSETLDRIRTGLTAAVEQPWGTGYRTVRLSDIRIAGKTGTAETSAGQADHAWFAGYVPADAPRYAFVVVLEHGGSGSQTAGPIVRELIRFMAARRLISDETAVQTEFPPLPDSGT